MKITIDTTGLTSRLLEAVGLTTKDAVNTQAQRAFEAGYMDGNDDPVSGDLRHFGYRSSMLQGRELTKISQDELITIAWSLFQSNPMAKRYLEIVRDHILGRGVSPNIKDDKLREIVDTFWLRNKFSQRLKKFVFELRLFGEQCYPAFVRRSDGRVTLGYVDPSEIENVVCHPDNALDQWAVVLKPSFEYKRRAYRIIRRDEGYVSNGQVITPNIEGKLVTASQARLQPWESALLGELGLSAYSGSCFYHSTNNVSNMPRGFTDLLQVADWLDASDETLFALTDRENIAGYFSWDIELTGASEAEVKAKSAEIRARVPKKGQAIVHNDSEKWTMNSPDLKQSGSIQTYEAAADLAWGTLGMARHWRGLGDGTNRATAQEMGGPIHRTLETKQDEIRDIIIDILEFVRDQAEIAGTLRNIDEEDRIIEVQMPEMSKRDTNQAAQTLNQVTQSINVLMNDLKLIRKETASDIVSKAIAELGIEYDPAEELEEIEKAGKDEEKSSLDKQQQTNDQLQALLSKVTNANGQGTVQPEINGNNQPVQ